MRKYVWGAACIVCSFTLRLLWEIGVIDSIPLWALGAASGGACFASAVWVWRLWEFPVEKAPWNRSGPSEERYAYEEPGWSGSVWCAVGFWFICALLAWLNFTDPVEPW